MWKVEGDVFFPLACHLLLLYQARQEEVPGKG
jgi:hypothetical protein